MIDDELQEIEGLLPLSEFYEEDEPISLHTFAAQIPPHLFLEMHQASLSYEVMMQASEKLSFAYCDMIRKIEVL